MNISSGQYTIKSVSANKLVGRSEREDLSLNPKRVILLPEGVRPPIFEIRSTGNGYRINARGSGTATFDRLLWAILLEEPAAEEWKIKAIPQSGPNRFIITKANEVEGWVMPEDQPETQIAVRPLIVGPSEPPFYPPNQVWEIRPLLD